MKTTSYSKRIALWLLGMCLIAENPVKGDGSDWVAGTHRCTTPNWAATRTNIRKSLIAGDGIYIDYYTSPEACYSGVNPFKWTCGVDYPNDFQWNNGTSTVAPIGFAS